jgi:hypothetical protein
MVTKEQKGTKILLGNGKDKRLIPLPIQNEIHLKRID